MSLDTAYTDMSNGAEQVKRIRRLFSAVVLELIDQAIERDSKFRHRGINHVGRDELVTWARSADGRDVLTLAGIEPSPSTAARLGDFVDRGVRTAISLSTASRNHVDAEQDAD